MVLLIGFWFVTNAFSASLALVVPTSMNAGFNGKLTLLICGTTRISNTITVIIWFKLTFTASQWFVSNWTLALIRFYTSPSILTRSLTNRWNRKWDLKKWDLLIIKQNCEIIRRRASGLERVGSNVFVKVTSMGLACTCLHVSLFLTSSF